ncbi:MAG: DEAD/DEAH box helicase [Chlamydiota bacterium]|nr:DEAD/DEAH box helicase [Chlamydiota bacterium]
MSFKELNLIPSILKSIEKSGYTTPTPIQEQAIPRVLEGHDIRGCAQTGTGKTAAFILPTLQKLSMPSNKPGKGPRALVLVPTRELAMQVADAATKYGSNMNRMKTVCIYGGQPYPVQNRQLSRHHEILVATPGRLIDHLNRGRIDFSRLELFILDEADRMLDMGFIDDVEMISSKVPSDVQNLMFSATFKGHIMKLSQKLLKDPVEIMIEPNVKSHENIEQILHYVDNMPHKLRILDHLLDDETLDQAVIFTSTKSFADELVDKLKDRDHKAEALHGDMSQHKRTKTIKRMREGKFRILVATDVAARGIDIHSITHVINFDLPQSVEDYVHRIGRTGRAQNKGTALTFAAPKDTILLRKIEEFTGKKITPQEIAGLEPTIKDRSGLNTRSNKNGRSRPRRAGRFKEGGNSRRSGERRSGERRFGRSDESRDSKKSGENGGWSKGRRFGAQKDSKPGNRSGGRQKQKSYR